MCLHLSYKFILQVNSLQQNIENSIPFEKLLEEFYIHKKSEIKITSLEKMKRANAIHILPFFKGMRINKINVRTIEKWKLSILEKDLALLTIQKLYVNLSLIWKYAMKYYDIPTNYVQIAGNFKSTNYEEREYKVWTVDEFQKVDIVMKEMCERDKSPERIKKFGMRLAINIMFWCGLRLGESHALRWKDFIESEDGSYLNIPVQYQTKLKVLNIMNQQLKQKHQKVS